MMRSRNSLACHWGPLIAVPHQVTPNVTPDVVAATKTVTRMRWVYSAAT